MKLSKVHPRLESTIFYGFFLDLSWKMKCLGQKCPSFNTKLPSGVLVVVAARVRGRGGLGMLVKLHPARHRTCPHSKESLVPNAHSAEAEEPCVK